MTPEAIVLLPGDPSRAGSRLCAFVQHGSFPADCNASASLSAAPVTPLVKRPVPAAAQRQD
jgi:hypothetical protein